MSRAFNWLDKRYGLTPLVDFLKHKEVPVGAHSMVWYYLGGTTLFFFAAQVCSGLLLLLYYQPGEATAYESIRFITTKVPFGWLMRSLHCWSAHLMIVSLIVHMFSTMFLKAYRPPRELSWVTGFVLFMLALGFGFSGYLLPWNELAFFATSVGTESMKAVPGIGEWLLQVLRGGADVSANTLYRFFALHVVALPLAMVGLVGLHLLFIQRQGMAAHLGEKVAKRGLRFFPDFLLRDLLLWLVCLIVLLSLAVSLPYGPGLPGVEWELGKKANPLTPAYPGIKPEWYFLWVYQLLKEFPPHIWGMEGPQAAVGLVSVMLGIWAAVPWLDRRAQRDEHSAAFTDLGVAAILFVGYLTLLAWDIGGGGAKVPDPHVVAHATSIIALVAAAAIFALRFIALRHRFFLLSGAAILQIGLHGLFRFSYVHAGMAGLALIIAGFAWLLLRPHRPIKVPAVVKVAVEVAP